VCRTFEMTHVHMQIDIIVQMFVLQSEYISLLMALLVGLHVLVSRSPVNNEGLFPEKSARSNW
jgi:hypothetical protein